MCCMIIITQRDLMSFCKKKKKRKREDILQTSIDAVFAYKRYLITTFIISPINIGKRVKFPIEYCWQHI